MAKVLISDKLSPRAAKVFEDRGIEVEVETGLSPDELIARIGAFDGCMHDRIDDVAVRTEDCPGGFKWVRVRDADNFLPRERSA